ncbi:MAG: anaerobic ribonucleoside-triphosphate reductase [Candidatus Hermodarchaeota archaeon]
MIAWYLTEGWAIGDHAIGFSQTRKKYLEDIGTSLRDLNCPFHIREREKGKQEYIIGGFLGTFINNTCGKYCDDKKIPEFIFDLSNNLKNVFINEIIKGDGYKRSTGWVYTSTSNVLITGLNLMLISLGYRTSIRTRFDKNFENHKCGSSTRDKAKLTRYDLIIHENEEKILNFNDFESAVIFKNCQHHFNSQYEYDLSIEGSEAFIGGVGLFALHNSSVDTLLAPFIREKFEKSVEKILRQIFSLKVNGQGYELLDLLYAYRKGEIQASDICAKLESFYLNIIFRDDLIQTFLRSFNEEYEDNVSFIRQNIQNLIYALNQTSRWGGQCVSEDTQCLTDTGWKYYNELDSENDKIATFNGITHKIEYLNPQKINIFDYDGDLISIKNRSQDQLLTPNHRVVRKVFNADKYILESAENLFKYKTRIQIPNSAPTYSNFEIEDHLVELLAWLVSEGGFSTGPRKRVHLYQSVKNQECVDLIRKCLTANKFKWDEQKRIHGYGKHELISFRLNQESSRKIREIINSKQIPEFIRNLSRRQIKLFLDTYIKGDGHVEKKGRIRFYTKDESVKDSLQELCVLAGYGSTVHQQVNKVFSINLIRNSITNITQISKIPYKGKVWCPTTLNGTFVARRMDKTFITGNSPFVNLSFDWKVPSDLADQAAIIRGQPHESILYRDCQTEMDIFNRVFMEEMHQGDKHNRVFTFPIPTYSITKDFDWNHPNVDLLMQITARYGIPYFQNYCLVKETKIIGRDLKGRIRKTDLKSLREDWSILTPDGFKKVLKKYTVRYDNYPISITFSNGENISCSENHLFPTSTGLKKAKDLEKDDFVLVGERAYDENTRGGNYSYGRFLGLYLGDGYIEKGKTRINFPNKDKTIIDFANKFSKKAFMSTNTLNQRKDGLYNLYINSRAAVSYIFDFTLGSNAKTKRLRSSIFDTSREFREGLIKGYHEADGNKSKHNRFEVSSTSHQLIKDMRSILISLGKRTTRRRKCIEAKGNDRKYLYTLTEASENVQQSRIFKEINGNTYCKVVKIGRSKSFSKELIDIQIEGEDKLFTLACGVVTHNSGTGLEPSSIRAMCCRLNLNLLELKNRPGGMWSIGDSTGSIGVVTINLNRLGYLAVDKDDFFRLLRKYMDLAKMSLEIKRKEITRNLEKGMMAFATNYLPHGFQTYFSTIGLCGMHECCLNFLKRGIDTPEGLKFAEKILRFMRNICEEYKKETGNLYNLEATPAESTSYRFARLDKKWYPTIITSGNANGYFLTNSTHLPVDATTDLIKAIEHQNVLQPLYSGGTIFHTFLGEEIDPEACKNIVRQISEKTQLPYFSITPTFSICTEHRYIKGKHFTCPHCGKPTEVYSRIVGYFRPVSKWNDGKTQEFKERVMFELHDFDKIREIQMTEIREAKTSYIPELNADSAIQSEVVNENTSNGNYIAVFVSPTCPKCGPFKRLLHQLVDTIEIRTIDTSTEEGLRLVREFGILQLPTAIVFTEEGNTFRFSTIEELNEYLPILQNL